MNLRPQVAVSRRTLVQKQQRILDVNGIRVKRLLEQFSGIAELRFELGPDLGSDRIAALSDARPDRSAQIAQGAAKLAAHLADTLLDHARNGSAPTRVKRTHHAPLRVGHQHWDTVGGLDRQQESRGVSDHAVARWRMRRARVDVVDDGRMNLLDLHQGPRTAIVVDGTHSLQKQRAIAFDVGMRVMLRLSEVERTASVTGGNAALSRTESMDQPGNFGERVCSKNLEGIRA